MATRICTVNIKGISPYSPSKAVNAAAKPKEVKFDVWEAQTWRQKAHYDEKGFVVIPFMSFKKAITTAGSLTKRKISGKGNQTYAALIKSGVLMDQSLKLPLKEKDLRGETFSCSITGDTRGVGGRVDRTFPMIDTWGGDLVFYVTNPEIPRDVFEEYVTEAGQFIGVGRFRPENGGINGRFLVNSFSWKG
jgi:hypothetical protein